MRHIKNIFMLLGITLLIVISVMMNKTTNLTTKENNKEAMNIKKSSQGVIRNYTLNIRLQEGIENAEYNTNLLQYGIDLTSYYVKTDKYDFAGILVEKPGKFYFAPKEGKSYCIKCRDYAMIAGAKPQLGTTTFIPYGNSEDGGITMFYFDGTATIGEEQDDCLDRVTFMNFIIDGSQVKSSSVYKFNTPGQGISLTSCNKCTFKNITIKNTYASGFEVNYPINCEITNCIAENCGTGITKSTQKGGAGFEIGIGKSNTEKIIIDNCQATNCGKYGFYFENQSRFSNSDNYFNATEGKFIVSNCTAYDNMYDFGGERAYDVTYRKCISKIGNGKTKSSYHFGDMSVRCKVTNSASELTFKDVDLNTETESYKAIKWALDNGITEMNSARKFHANSTLTRKEVVTFLHRFSDRDGELIKGSIEYIKGKSYDRIYDDVFLSGGNYYEYAVKWAKENNITKGTTKNLFSPDAPCTRVQIVTFLYRYAGSPEIDQNIKLPYTDIYELPSDMRDAVTWAHINGITKGTSKTKFSPNTDITRLQIVVMLYRYAQNI